MASKCYLLNFSVFFIILLIVTYIIIIIRNELHLNHYCKPALWKGTKHPYGHGNEFLNKYFKFKSFFQSNFTTENLKHCRGRLTGKAVESSGHMVGVGDQRS